MRVIIYPDVDVWNSVLDGLCQRTDVQCVPLNRACGFFRSFIRHRFGKCHLPVWMVFGRKLVTVLSGLGNGDIVILADYSDPSLFYALKDCTKPGVSLHYWLWNPVKNNKRIIENLGLYNRLQFRISTFDSGDAIKYGFSLKNQFYPVLRYIGDSPSNCEYDFYFAGFAKDRKSSLIELKNNLSRFKTKFIIVDRAEQCISYSENVQNIKKSRCLVEIVQGEQYGLSLRPLEAMAFKKKLLTNNSVVEKCQFYKKNNIFILGKDDLSDIELFLETSFDEIPEKVTSEYDVNTWIESFD